MAYIIGIDIGTTNIEYAFINQYEEKLINYIERNPLSQYGQDVMTRITKANDGLLKEMSIILRHSLNLQIERIISYKPNQDYRIRIAANTTMVHILMGYDCTNLAGFPFEPVHTEEIETISDALDFYEKNIPVTITPGLSAFIGGDIVSGLSTLPKKDNFLFIDLGTNAEMVLVQGNDAYLASAAAGPAFETCTYGHATDALDGLTYMLQKGIVDENGLLSDEYFEKGFDYREMHFTQRKIRDLQMAKAAIRTGIDYLFSEYENKTDIAVSNIINPDFKIYIAGTFGANLNVINAIYIRMFPDWFSCRCKLLGNTSLAGTLSSFKEYDIYNKNLHHIQLANMPDFQKRYINNINF